MSQPFLYMRNASQTLPDCAVFIDLDGQLVQVGADFGVSEDDTTLAQKTFNRVIHWKNDLYAINNKTIFKYDVAFGSGTWEVFYTFANPSVLAKTTYTMGFVPCSIDGSGVLCTAYPTNDTPDDTFRVVKIDKDMNVTEGPAINAVFGTTHEFDDVDVSHFIAPLSWRNNLIWRTATDASAPDHIDVYDLKTDMYTKSIIADNSSTSNTSQFVILRDKVYGIEREITSSDVQLNRLEGASFIDSGEITTDNYIYAEGGGGGMVVINDKIYVLMLTAGAPSQYRLFELTINVAGNISLVTNISSLLPSSITSLTSTNGTTRFRVDNTTNGPENPIYHVEIANGTNAGISLYEWIDAPSGDIVFIASRMTAQEFSHIQATDGSSGPFIWSGSGTFNVSQPCLSLSLDALAMNMDVNIYGSPGATGISLEFYFDKQGEFDSTRATISSTSVGVLNSNTVEGLIVGDMVSVRWEAVTDGIVTGDNPKIHGRVFRP
jgi:hypothetical protein